MACKHKYDIVTVDWNEEETAIWECIVRKQCPDANIVKVPDRKLIPTMKTASKATAFAQDFETDRIIYLDTDTVVMKPLDKIFTLMPPHKSIGLSTNFKLRKIQGTYRKEIEDFGVGDPYHPFSGMIVMWGVPALRRKYFANVWITTLKLIEKEKLFAKSGDFFNDEAGLALTMPLFFDRQEDVWEFPEGIHITMEYTKEHGGAAHNKKAWHQPVKNVVLSEPIPPQPFVLHYHKKEILKEYGWNHLIES